MPATDEPHPTPIRVGLDGAIGMIEWMQGILKGDTVPYNDLRELVIKMSTFGNRIDYHIPAEVIQFLYTAGRWKKWQEDTKQGHLLPGADETTGFVK